MRINRLLTSTGAALLLASGLASQANAGAINMDFLDDDSTVIMDGSADAGDADTPGDDEADNTKTVASPGLSAGFAVDLTPFGSTYAGKTLNITGTRDAVPEYLGDDTSIRLTRHEGAGLAVCSRYDDNGSSTGCRESSGEHAVDGDDDSNDGQDDVNESIKFAISDGTVFAVRFVTFTFVDGNDDGDDVRMRFKTGLGTFIDFDLEDPSGVDYSDGDCGGLISDSDTCTVDIYKLAAWADGAGGLVFDNTFTGYDLGQDAIFDYLASAAGFEFQARGSDDDWKIAGARWVTEDPITNGVPEPASMTLLGAGIMGLGYFGKRRKAA